MHRAAGELGARKPGLASLTLEPKSKHDAALVQAAKKELALAMAVAFKRFPEGSAERPARDEAEKAYADAMAQIGTRLGDAAVLAMAAEAHMNLSPWDYYQVSRAWGGTRAPGNATGHAAMGWLCTQNCHHTCEAHAADVDALGEASTLRLPHESPSGVS